MSSKKTGRQRKSHKSVSPRPRNFDPPILVPKTDEMKIEEAKEVVMEKMLDPENITPETMPSFASLDSYIGTMKPEIQTEVEEPKDNPVPDNPYASEDTSEDTSEIDVEDDGGVVEIDHTEDYVEIAPPKPKPKASNIENLKVYNRMKEENAKLSRALAAAEEDLRGKSRALENEERNSEIWRGRALRAETELAEMKRKSESSVQKTEYDKVVSENDELILKNSELELENSILKESNKKKECERATQPPAYTNHGYSKPNSPMNNTRPSMNGYEDWI